MQNVIWPGSIQIAHALGPIMGEAYTNSREAFQKNYAYGHRFFEVDIVCLADGCFVAAHPGLEVRYGCEEFSTIRLEQFPAHYIGLRTLTWERVRELASNHPDVRFIVDIKSGRDVMYRQHWNQSGSFIFQLYTHADLEKHASKLDYLLAHWGYDRSDEEFLQDCRKYAVPAVSLHSKLIESDLQRRLEGIGIHIVWHGEIYAGETATLLSRGHSVMNDCHFVLKSGCNQVDEAISATQTVYECYLSEMGRAPDEAGLHHYCRMLLKGMINRDELKSLLQISAEGQWFSQHGGGRSMSEKEPIASIKDVISSFYNVFYGRQLDPLMINRIKSLVEVSDDPYRDIFKIINASSEFRSFAEYIPIAGHYDRESQLCWFRREATLMFKEIPLYLSIPREFPHSQALTITRLGQIEKHSLFPGEAVKLRKLSSLLGEVVQIDASSQWSSFNDVRKLAFQASTGSRELKILRESPTEPLKPPIIAVSGSPKEYRILSILTEGLNQEGITVHLFHQSDAKFSQYVAARSGPLCFLIASADTFFLCEREVDQAIYIYIEHGIAPFKGYTYAAHYHNYDHVMLPSDFWKNRIEAIHGPLKSCQVVGYPVVGTVPLGLKKYIDVLFAPTWCTSKQDVSLIRKLTKLTCDVGLRVAFAGHPDSLLGLGETDFEKLVEISDVYDALAKTRVVVTDFSSVGIEAAALGLPIAITRRNYCDDFDQEYNHGGLLEVPHSGGVIWDIGPEVDENNCVDLLQSLCVQAGRDAFREKRETWVKFCHTPPVLQSRQMAIDSVIQFLSSIGIYP
jgi:hypothetical protein